MSWASIANNQTITCNNLQNAVDLNIFVLKNTIPVSNKCITKLEASNYVYCSITSYSPSQLPVKSNLTPTFPEGWSAYSGYESCYEYDNNINQHNIFRRDSDGFWSLDFNTPYGFGDTKVWVFSFSGSFVAILDGYEQYTGSCF